MLGQYGGNSEQEPDILYFDDDVNSIVRDVLGDATAKVYTVTY